MVSMNRCHDFNSFFVNTKELHLEIGESNIIISCRHLLSFDYKWLWAFLSIRPKSFAALEIKYKILV